MTMKTDYNALAARATFIPRFDTKMSGTEDALRKRLARRGFRLHKVRTDEDTSLRPRLGSLAIYFPRKVRPGLYGIVNLGHPRGPIPMRENLTLAEVERFVNEELKRPPLPVQKQ